MLFLRLWNYIRGYVIILIEGYFIEKFINICAHRQIYLWDINRRKGCALTLKVSIKGFKLLRPVARKTKCRVRIVRKRGLPFLFNRYRKRKTFVLGAVLFILLLYALTSFIWAIEIEGNKALEKDVILERLGQTGLKTGVLKYGIDTEKAVNSLMLSLKELAWASISIKGTKVKVQVAERKIPPALIPKNEPCDIVARRDGVIHSIAVKDGMEIAKAGDTVTRGQILVSGSIPVKGEEGRFRLVHSIATVIARTWYEKQKPVETIVFEKERTGNKKDKYFLLLFSKRIGIWGGKVGFKEYDMVEIRKNLSIGKDMVLPLGLANERYFESITKEKEISQEEAKQIAADKAKNEIMQEIPENARIIRTSLNYRETSDGAINAVISVECMEEIGRPVRIGGN